MSIWQKRANIPYTLATAEGSRAAFWFTLLISLIILFSYWKMFKVEKSKTVK